MPFRALIDACWKEKYTAARFTRDLIAGITVGIIAIPLAMALAIGSGVAPQYGLYTAAVAGIVIALTGGSRFSVSGPTAAFACDAETAVVIHHLRTVVHVLIVVIVLTAEKSFFQAVHKRHRNLLLSFGQLTLPGTPL